jgi:hypothetical protein
MQIDDNIHNIPKFQIAQLATNYLGQHLTATHPDVNFQCNGSKIFVYDKRSDILVPKTYCIDKNYGGHVDVYEGVANTKKNNLPCHTLLDVVNTICNDLQ